MIRLELDPTTGKATLSGLNAESLGLPTSDDLAVIVEALNRLTDRVSALEKMKTPETPPETPPEIPAEIPGWEFLGWGWQGEVVGTFGEARLRKGLVEVRNNNNNITLHFSNGAVLTQDGWYNFSEEQIVSYIGI